MAFQGADAWETSLHWEVQPQRLASREATSTGRAQTKGGVTSWTLLTRKDKQAHEEVCDYPLVHMDRVESWLDKAHERFRAVAFLILVQKFNDAGSCLHSPRSLDGTLLVSAGKRQLKDISTLGLSSR